MVRRSAPRAAVGLRWQLIQRFGGDVRSVRPYDRARHRVKRDLREGSWVLEGFENRTREQGHKIHSLAGAVLERHVERVRSGHLSFDNTPFHRADSLLQRRDSLQGAIRARQFPVTLQLFSVQLPPRSHETKRASGQAPLEQTRLWMVSLPPARHRWRESAECHDHDSTCRSRCRRTPRSLASCVTFSLWSEPHLPMLQSPNAQANPRRTPASIVPGNQPCSSSEHLENI